MANNTTTQLLNSITTTTTTTTQIIASTLQSTTSVTIKNDSIFNLLTSLLNGTELYKYQIADLIEPEKYSTRHIHIIIWVFSILTYLLAIPIAMRMIRSKVYINTVEYFSLHIIFCAFIAWFPALTLIFYHWFQTFTLKLCRIHYVILSTNETVPLFFILYMVMDRFLYVYPSFKQKCTRFTHMYFFHLYAIFTWLLIMLIYAFASPFNSSNQNSIISKYIANYCPYNYTKLRIIATTRSIIYFCLFIPALVLIGFVLKFFYIMRGTNQIPSIEKLWTIRVTSLLCMIVFYDIYFYYLEHIIQTNRSFLVLSLLRSTFYLVQIFIIACTDLYWMEMFIEHCVCFFCMLKGKRRKTTVPVAVPTETEFHTVPYSPPTGHYSLVDDTVDDEFDRATNGPEPTLRVIP